MPKCARAALAHLNLNHTMMMKQKNKKFKCTLKVKKQFFKGEGESKGDANEKAAEKALKKLSKNDKINFGPFLASFALYKLYKMWENEPEIDDDDDDNKPSTSAAAAAKNLKKKKC